MKEKTALITGCSSGIGRALALRLTDYGVKVIATARKPEKISRLKESGIIVKKLDVTNFTEMENLVEWLNREKLHPDILINNAGYGVMGPALEVPLDAVINEFMTNVFGLLKLAQLIGRGMAERRNGVIVNIGSIAGMLTTPFASIYSSSKAAVNALSDGLRVELKPFGVKVITVQPGAIVSRFGENALENTMKILSENSIYLKYKEKVLKRAELSQQNATSTELFADKLISKILSKNPPPVFRFGKKSFVAFFLSRFIPANLRDIILSRAFGL